MSRGIIPAPVNGSIRGPQSRAWIEVNLAAVVENARTVARIAGTRLLPGVKANAYGVGAVAVSKGPEAADPWGDRRPRGPDRAPTALPGGEGERLRGRSRRRV